MSRMGLSKNRTTKTDGRRTACNRTYEGSQWYMPAKPAPRAEVLATQVYYNLGTEYAITPHRALTSISIS